jgi:hypothetical protein
MAPLCNGNRSLMYLVFASERSDLQTFIACIYLVRAFCTFFTLLPASDLQTFIAFTFLVRAFCTFSLPSARVRS